MLSAWTPWSISAITSPSLGNLQGFFAAPDPTGQGLREGGVHMGLSTEKGESAQLLLAVIGILSFIVVVISN